MEENVIQINGGLMINVDVSIKNIIYVKKIMFGILLHAAVKIKKYLASIMDDSVIICDEVIDSYYEKIKTIPTNFNEKNITCKRQNFYILLAFLLITITLLRGISIYCCLIKYHTKQKHRIKSNLY